MSDNKIEQIENRIQELEDSYKTQQSESQLRSPQEFGFNDTELDLKELWNIIWNGKVVIIATTLVFAVASVVFALSLSDEYKSSVTLQPASTSNSSNLSRLAGQFGGLASLAGINLGNVGGTDNTSVAIEILRSWSFIEKFIEDTEIQVPLFAGTGWNRQSDKLLIDPSLYDESTNECSTNE